MTKIEPVSKAAAKFFMREVLQGDSNLHKLVGAHRPGEKNCLHDDWIEFAAFCRAVADQHDLFSNLFPIRFVTYLYILVARVEIHMRSLYFPNSA